MFAQPAPNPAAGITRVTLEHHAVPGTDLEMRMVLITFPPSAASPVHHHPVAGLNYIVSGTAESAYGSAAPKVYHAGDTLQDVADTPHSVFRNADPHAPLKFLIFYTAKPGQPYLVIP